MAVEYTHNFEIKVDGLTLAGEIEFNADGLVSYRLINDPNIPLDTMQLVNKVFDDLKTLYKIHEGLEKFEVIIK